MHEFTEYQDLDRMQQVCGTWCKGDFLLCIRNTHSLCVTMKLYLCAIMLIKFSTLLLNIIMEFCCLDQGSPSFLGPNQENCCGHYTYTLQPCTHDNCINNIHHNHTLTLSPTAISLEKKCYWLFFKPNVWGGIFQESASMEVRVSLPDPELQSPWRSLLHTTIRLENSPLLEPI